MEAISSATGDLTTVTTTEPAPMPVNYTSARVSF